jgi:hypothetical protein
MIIEKASASVNGISLEYVLHRNGAVYSIEITEQNGDVHSSCRLADIARNKDKALFLLRLLAENSVCPASAPYVIDDLADELTFC